MKKIIVSPLCTASICLSVTLLAAGLAAQIAAALVPNIILPALDIPTLAALSLLALVLEVILFGENHRFWATSLIVGTVAFGVLSLCAGSVPTVLDALRVGILGGAVFLICEVLLHSILDRISSGAAGKYPRSMAVVSALLLWLAAQILMSIGIDNYGRGSHTAGPRAVWIGSPVQSSCSASPDYPFRYRLYAEHRKAEAA